MQISTVFPSNYLRAVDLGSATPTVTIDKILVEDVGSGDQKPVLYFRGKNKGVVLNKTNASNISLLYGDETDAWIGKQITLFTTWVDFQGRSVQAIRVRPVRPEQGNVQQAAPPPAQHAPPPDAPLDDEIPF